MKEKIKGGVADNIPSDKFNSKSLKKGAKEELEHTDDKAVAKEIAKDHLAEDPEYYDKLSKIEEAFVDAICEEVNKRRALNERYDDFLRNARKEGMNTTSNMTLIGQEFDFDKQYTQLTANSGDYHYLICSKPVGLWYAKGPEWVKYIQKKYPTKADNIYNKSYLIDINYKKILRVKKIQDLDPIKDMITISEDYHGSKQVKFFRYDWQKITKMYDGIEVIFPDLETSDGIKCFRLWDVPSGCIWNVRSAVKGYKEVDYDKFKENKPKENKPKEQKPLQMPPDDDYSHYDDYDDFDDSEESENEEKDSVWSLKK